MKHAKQTNRVLQAAVVLLSTCALALPLWAQGNGGGKGGGGGGGSPPANPEIAYVTSNSLYVMNADGSNQTRLFHNGGQGSVHAPSWSPDGARIVFVARLGGLNALCVIDADGTGLQVIHTLVNQDPLPSGAGPKPDWSPAATPDGSERIVFPDRNPATGFVDIFVIDPDGSNPRPLTDAASSGESYEWVCWTRDATGLVRTDGAFIWQRLELMHLGLDGTGELTVVAETPLYDVTGVPGVLINADPAAAHGHDWIVVSVNVYVNGSHQSNAVVLDITDPFDVVLLSVIDSGLWHMGPGFSSDDSELVYYRSVGSTSGIFRVDVFGGEEIQVLGKGYEPDWR